MNKFSQQISLFGLLTLGLFAFSCKGHHDHAHDHEAYDEHSSLSMQIVKDTNSLAFAIEAHGDGLHLKGSESEVSLQDFTNRIGGAITFAQNTCTPQVPKSTLHEEGHHEIYLVNVSFKCEKEISAVDFHFEEIYESIKKIHVKILEQNNVSEKTIDANARLEF